MKEYIQKHNISFKRTNIRPWGGFELLISIDNGQNWAHVARAFGGAFTDEDAFLLLCEDWIKNNTIEDAQFQSWFGKERIDELKTVLENNKNNVQEHIHNESHGTTIVHRVPMG